ncbi:MAG: histidine kinase [Bacteroidota bacterium]
MMNISWDNWYIRLPVYMALNLGILLLHCPDCLFDWSEVGQNYLFSLILMVSLWEGNSHIHSYLSLRFPWLAYPVWRTVAGVLSATFYSTLIVVLAYFGFFILLHGYKLEEQLPTIINTIEFSLGITFIITLFLHTHSFLFNWREAAVRAEKLKKEQIATKYTTLTQQLNPHFLFNSLNVLNALVYQSPDQASAFIQKLSSLYRYMLDLAMEEVVPLSEEIEGVRNYAYLVKMRHGEYLHIDWQVPENTKGFIPPLSLQMMIENAIKHNEISKTYPLSIEIKEVGDELWISNQIQLKRDPEPSSGKGLKNIGARYELLGQGLPHFEEVEGIFIARLPILR